MPRLGSVSRRANEVKFDSFFSGLRDYWKVGKVEKSPSKYWSWCLPDVFFLFGGGGG